MSTIKLAPKNFPDIQKHFHKQKLKLQNELTSAYKKKKVINAEIDRLTGELLVCDSGVEWCEEVYKASKGK